MWIIIAVIVILFLYLKFGLHLSVKLKTFFRKGFAPSRGLAFIPLQKYYSQSRLFGLFHKLSQNGYLRFMCLEYLCLLSSTLSRISNSDEC